MLSFDPKVFGATYGGVTVINRRANAIVYAQGDPAEALFYIQQGKVKLSVVSEQGKEAVVAILEAGDLCGEGCLNGQPLRISTATAMSDCVMARERERRPRPAREPFLCRLFHRLPSDPERTAEGASDRSPVQLEREAAGARSSAVGRFWERNTGRDDHTEYQSGDIGEDDRHDPRSRQPFHEQVS
jgi:hypothetical protein